MTIRRGTYGQTIRIDCGIDLSQFVDITVAGSASAAVSALSFNLSASTLFIGNSTVYSSTLGTDLASGEWLYFQPGTADSWVTADAYTLVVHCSGSGTYWKSPDITISVDT